GLDPGAAQAGAPSGLALRRSVREAPPAEHRAAGSDKRAPAGYHGGKAPRPLPGRRHIEATSTAMLGFPPPPTQELGPIEAAHRGDAMERETPPRRHRRGSWRPATLRARECAAAIARCAPAPKSCCAMSPRAQPARPAMSS